MLGAGTPLFHGAGRRAAPADVRVSSTATHMTYEMVEGGEAPRSYVNVGRSGIPLAPPLGLTASTWWIWLLPSSKVIAHAAM